MHVGKRGPGRIYEPGLSVLLNSVLGARGPALPRHSPAGGPAVAFAVSSLSAWLRAPSTNV
jgi:hypothetical protein